LLLLVVQGLTEVVDFGSVDGANQATIPASLGFSKDRLDGLLDAAVVGMVWHKIVSSIGSRLLGTLANEVYSWSLLRQVLNLDSGVVCREIAQIGKNLGISRLHLLKI
jgi:hypothetical protein